MAPSSRARNLIGLVRPILPLLPILIAFILQWMYWPAIRPFAWFLFYPAVFVSTWMGGRASGLLASAISAVLVWWFFLPYERSFTTVTSQSLVSVAVFMGMGGLFSFFHGRLREATRQATLRSRESLLLALSQAAVTVQRARTPDEIYRAVGDEIVKLGHHAAVFTLAADREHLELSYLTFEPALLRRAEKLAGGSAEGYRFPLVPGSFYQRIIADGQAVFSARLADHIADAMPGRARHLVGPIAGMLGLIKQSILAPLQVGGESHGLLVVFGSGLTEADVPAVTVFAKQTTIALDNVRLYQEARQLAERLAALNEIAAAVASSLEIEKVFDSVADAMQRLVNFDRVSIALLDAEGKTITIFALRTETAASDLERGLQVPVPASVLEVRRTGRGIVLHDLEGSVDPLDQALVGEGILSALVAPLVSGGQVIGTCNLGSREPEAYGEEQLALLQAVAEQIAPAVENARLLAGVRASATLLQESEAHLRAALEQSEERKGTLLRAQQVGRMGFLDFDLRTNTIEWSDEVYRLYGVEHDEDTTAAAFVMGLVHPDDLERVQANLERAVQGLEHDEIDHRIVRPDGGVIWVHAQMTLIRDANGTPAHLLGTVVDITARKEAEAERSRLATAVEQTSDLVIITDPAGTIEYVNPAFEWVSGYRRDEAIGQNPRILKSGHQPVALYRAMWRQLTGGRTWTGTLVNRRKDGSLYEAESRIAPIRDPGGVLIGYIDVQRDITALRAAETGLAREFRERAAAVAALARLQPLANPKATAAAICDGLVGLPGIDFASIVTFASPRYAVPLATAAPDGFPLAPGRPLPAARARYLYERAVQGPWAEKWRPRPEDGRYGAAMAEFGTHAIAYAPIRDGAAVIGVVSAGTFDEEYATHLIERLPAVGEFAAAAGALLSGPLRDGRLEDVVRKRVLHAMAQGRLRPVFQPIVALASGEPVGYEALVRFADGTPPDEVIALAHAVGLGLELELACLAAALDASEALPQDTWLSLNVSPNTLLNPVESPALLSGRSRPIVLEITEHAEIDDYGAVRTALAALGPAISLAVDDAGAGFASLRHVIELEPSYLKLDISLVRGIERSPSRRAMVASLMHFAERSGCQVIAEGIEEPEELAMLRELGVALGQGYLLGRPEPLPAVSGSTRQRGPATTVRRSASERTGALAQEVSRRGASQGPRGR